MITFVQGGDVQPVAWGNIPMFDWRSRLQRGERVLYMWPVTDDMQFMETVCNPIGKWLMCTYAVYIYIYINLLTLHIGLIYVFCHTQGHACISLV